jgi:hypothetical protein
MITCMWRTSLRNPLLLAMIFSMLSLSISVRAQTPPLADTYASSVSPKANYGKNTTLIVLSGTTSYIQFNLAGVPANTPISKATLRVFVDAVTASGSFDVYQLNSAWAENTLTYNKAPALGASATGGNPVLITSANLHDFVLVDITSLAQSWINGTTANYGVALALVGSTGSFSFDSKESTLTSHEAELEIVLNDAGSVGPQGPQGPAGPEGLTGPMGLTGSQGAPGVNGASFNFRNAFDPTAIYAANDAVTYSGSTYVAITASGPNTQTPDQNPAAWSVMAQQGGIGTAGPQGATGVQGSQGSIGLPGSVGPVGPTGATGLQGQTGAIGLIGPQGPQGQTGANGTGINFRNAFDPAASYAVNDVVTYRGSSYTAIATSSGPNNPTPDQNPSAWNVTAQTGAAGAAGAQGAQGTQGAQGPQGPIGLTGAAGAAGSAGPAGAQGSVGAQGPQGSQGPKGASGIGLKEYRAALLQWYPQSFPTGIQPYSVAFDGSNLWVTNVYLGTVTELLASTGALVGTYSVGQDPQAIAFDGTNIWVANVTSGTVTKLLASTGALVGTYSVGQYPSSLAFDGTNIWVANGGSSSVTKLLASTGAMVGTYTVGQEPSGVAFDGTNIWVAGGNSLTKLLASTGAVAGTFSVVNVVAVAFDGTNIWVTNYNPGTVTKLLASTGAVVGTYSVGQLPQALAFDGTNIWVANGGSYTVAKLLASTGVAVGTYSVAQPTGLAFDGVNVWVPTVGSSYVTKIPGN